jgi:TIGR03009 family protein
MARLLLVSCFVLLLIHPQVVLAQTKAAQAPGSPQVQLPPGKTYPARPVSDAQPIIEPNPAAQNRAAQPVVPPMPQQPDWAARMTPEEQKWIDDVLRYWEARSAKIKLFEGKFQKWDYENGWLNPANGQRRERTYAEGAIKYAQPDKGLFRVEKLVSVLPPNQPGGAAQEVLQSPELGEHWICDGEKIYSFEANKKQVTVTPLPPHMRGQAIADGPLPFMFGARAESIKARYWIHGLADGPPGKYKLEAVPKSREDAQNFKSVIIVLDQQDYLPDSLQIFAPNYDPPRNDARQTYVFPAKDRVAKDEATLADMVKRGLDPFGLIRRDFFNPAIPAGWKKVDQNAVANVPAGPPPPPQQAGAAPATRPQGAVR